MYSSMTSLFIVLLDVAAFLLGQDDGRFGQLVSDGDRSTAGQV